MSTFARVGFAFLLFSAAIGAQGGQPAPSSSGASAESPPKRTIAFADVAPLWESLLPYAPSRLAGLPADDLASGWREWTRAHNAEIRARVARGDEDSLVNFWLFGTSYTERPPARPRDVAARGGGATLSEVANRRLDDLLDALESPGGNRRLRWVDQVLGARGIDPAAADGRARARELLSEAGRRMVSENANFERTLEAPKPDADPFVWMSAFASLYQDRGLSSDTSFLSSFAIDSALEALAASGAMAGRPIRRVAVIGPGLDFINKADGHDFYPDQTIQPFALIDSLIRLGLSRSGDMSVTTFDVSDRVNRHILDARDRARGGEGYLIHLPLGDGEHWSPALARYWEQAGGRIGEPVRAAAPPPSAGNVKVRAVRVRPDVVLSVTPRDLNIVLERLEPLQDDERFDLIVATNVFIYYDTFEQALAVVNAGRMLRPGGSLLSNQAIRAVAPMKAAVGYETVVYSDRQFDHVFWYRRE